MGLWPPATLAAGSEVKCAAWQTDSAGLFTPQTERISSAPHTERPTGAARLVRKRRSVDFKKQRNPPLEDGRRFPLVGAAGGNGRAGHAAPAPAGSESQHLGACAGLTGQGEGQGPAGQEDTRPQEARRSSDSSRGLPPAADLLDPVCSASQPRHTETLSLEAEKPHWVQHASAQSATRSTTERPRRESVRPPRPS